jgi:citrate synthase
MKTMDPAAVRPFPGAPGALSVEALQERIGSIAAERQELRFHGAAPADLEENRRLLAATQWELSHALIERYLPELARAAA